MQATTALHEGRTGAGYDFRDSAVIVTGAARGMGGDTLAAHASQAGSEMVVSSSAESTGLRSIRSHIIRTGRSGRGRRPACVVRLRSVPS
jgi:hypothetical protein